VKKEKLPARRVRVLAVVMAVWGLVIGARLYFLQVVQSESYIERAADQQQDVVRITPRRGDILDRDGHVLASSVEVDSVFARPNEIKNPEATAKTLARLTGIPSSELLRKLNPKNRWVWIKRKISKDERKKIEKAKLKGVEFQTEFRRYYPNREMAAHLLGYVDVDEEGRSGLEGSYNPVVRGEPGKVLLLVDAHGRSYSADQQLPQAGATLTTTIDTSIQFFIEKELRAAAEKTHAAAISIVVMDPHSGAILGMASSPTYNPNDYLAFPQSSWSQNPSVALTYEPGSTFKMVTIAAALEEGLTTPDEKIFCENGAIVLFNRRIRDHNPYGLLSVREIMQNSSNVGTIKLALRVGEERLKSYIDRYGFGEKTAVDLPAEVRGMVRDVPEWTKTSIASVAIGQEVSVTPLQIAAMVSTVANGGIHYRPYVVQKVQDPKGATTEIKPGGTRVMSQTTAQQLREMLEDVVTDGTAKASQLEGYRAAGKTGTAQKIDPATRRYSATKHIGSFAGFAPASDPKLAIVVVVDEPKGQYYGAEVAAPVFKRIAEQVLRNKSVLPDVPRYAPHYTATPERTKEKPTPRPASRTEDYKVLDASMRSDSDRPLEVGEILVPDFSGQSFRQALDAIGKLGLVGKGSGTGRVVAQFPAPGARVRSGARVELKLSLK
jgi:cell division protein FtsI (penicillin-binding protein 3)